MKTVNARKLYSFLESRQNFSTWIKNRIADYDFVENQDFLTAPQKYGTANGGRPAIEYYKTEEYGVRVLDKARFHKKMEANNATMIT